MIRFEEILACGARFRCKVFFSCSFFCIEISNSYRIIWQKDCPFSTGLSLYFVRDTSSMYTGSILELHSMPLVSLSVLMPVPHCLDYCSFIMSMKIMLYLLTLFQNSLYFVVLGLFLAFQYESQVIFLTSAEACLNFD